MAACKVRRHVLRQVEAQGGWAVFADRHAQGESIADLARTLRRPDGRAISRNFLSGIVHATPEREALFMAARDLWRQQTPWERRQRRRATKGDRERRRALSFMHHGDQAPAPVVMPAGLELRHRTATLPPRPAAPADVGYHPPHDYTPSGVEWRIANGGYAWCHDCGNDRCSHAKLEYGRRANAYRDDRFRPRVNRGLV